MCQAISLNLPGGGPAGGRTPEIPPTTFTLGGGGFAGGGPRGLMGGGVLISAPRNDDYS